MTSRASVRAFLHLATATAVGLALVALPASAAKRTSEPRLIATGVEVAGVDLSGLTVEEAAEKLESRAGSHLSRDVRVGAAGRPFRLTAQEAGFEFDALKTAKRAYYKGRDHPPVPDEDRAGGKVYEDFVPLALTHSRSTVAQFAQSVAQSVYKAPRNARVRITVRHIYKRRARAGYAIDADQLTEKITAALEDEHASRRIHMRTHKVRATINANDLARTYGTILTVDRKNFKLRLFKRLKIRKTYGVAVGMAGLETPTGRYQIREKQVDPAWHVPNSSWAGTLAGQTIPGGAPDNPLKARWLGIADGVGIHGTGEPWSIGSAASHGCIRMRVPDVIDLYRRVPVGTRVLIK